MVVSAKHPEPRLLVSYDSLIRHLQSETGAITIQPQVEVSDPTMANQLIQLLANNKYLQYLAFRSNIGNNYGAQVVEALQDSETLRFLYIWRCDLRGQVSRIADVLGRHECLTHFSLYGCEIEPNEIDYVAEALKHNEVLHLANLKFLRFGAHGAQVLSDMLFSNFTLQRLLLEGNAIGDDGVTYLVEALLNNHTLTYLNLRNNDISDEGGTHLAVSLQKGTSLTSLNLASNRLSDATGNRLTDLIKKNETLLSMNLDRNTLSEDKRSNIKWLLDQNKALCKELFLSALKSDEKVPWKRSKLMVVGEGMAGKTTTTRSLLGKEFIPIWNSTVGISLQEVVALEGSKWKSARNDDYVSAAMTSIAQALNAKKPKEKRKSRPKRRIPSMRSLVAGPLRLPPIELKDGPKVEIPEEEEEHYEDFQANLTSTFTEDRKIKLSIWDYGGQTVFYALHHLFLTKYGVYLLVFDMRELIKNKEKTLDLIEFWLQSVNLHAREAPLIITGTFRSEPGVEEQLPALQTTLAGLVSDKFPQVVANEDMIFFPICNATGTGVSELRDCIVATTRGQDFLNLQISYPWMKCLDEITAEGNSNKRGWVTMRTAKDFAVKNEINPGVELDRMLDLFHELGVVVHFTSSQIVSDIVTTNPQWLINAISKVVRDPIHSYEESDVVVRVARMQNELDNLFQSGIATKDLLYVLWDRQHVDFLVELMRELLLLSDWPFESTEGTAYLVPSMIRDNSGLEPSGLQCRFEFDYLPIGVFERLLCLLVDYSASREAPKEPVLKHNICRIHLGKDDFLYGEREKNSIIIRQSSEKDANYILTMVRSMMQKINLEAMKKRLKWTTMLETDNGYMSYADAKEANVKPWFDIPKAKEITPMALDDFFAA